MSDVIMKPIAAESIRQGNAICATRGILLNKFTRTERMKIPQLDNPSGIELSLNSRYAPSGIIGLDGAAYGPNRSGRT